MLLKMLYRFCKIVVLILLNQCLAGEWTLENELEKNEKLREQDIASLREFCLSDLRVKPSSAVKDEELVGFLNVCNYDLEEAKKRAKVYFEIRSTTPEVFTNRGIKTDEVQNALDVGYLIALPKRTPEGNRIIIVGIRKPDPKLFNYTPSVKAQALTIDSCIHEDPTTPGYIIIYDLSGTSIGYATKWSQKITEKYTKYLTDGAPLNVKKMLYINSNMIANTILYAMRPFIDAKLWEKFKFHKKNSQALYEDVPKDCLPKEFGGELPSLETLRENTIEWLEKMQPIVDNV